MTDFTPCPKTIRLCIEALSKTARIIDPPIVTIINSIIEEGNKAAEIIKRQKNQYGQ